MRRAGPLDVADITALTRTAYAPWVAVIGREPLPMTVDYAAVVQTHLIDLLHQDSLIALIEMVPMAGHLLIENVAVHPDHQGRGLGRQLMDHAETAARRMGLDELRLYTNAAFARNLAFYQRLGYEVTERRPFREGHTVYFAKRL